MSYRSTQFLTWVGIPLFMGYVDSGAFEVMEKCDPLCFDVMIPAARIRSSVKDSILFYTVLLALSFAGETF